MSNTRRDLLVTGAAAGLSSVLGANRRIRLGVIGTGGRGKYLMREVTKAAGDSVQWVAVCDVYDVRRAEAAQQAGGSVEQYVDYKQVLDRKDIDAVIIATPDHWHATIAVDALRSGKDVYVEKPMVHYPEDGQKIVRAVRESGRILQAGTQGRLLPQFVEAKEKYIDSGAMGKIGIARTWYTSNRGYIQKPPTDMQRKPDGLDWNRWLGPGPKVDWNPEIYFSPYKWLHYDGGMIMGIGIHVVDSAHHWLGLTKPRAAMAAGGNYFYKDERDTPDAISCLLEYPEVTLTFEAECLTAPGVKTTAGVHLRGTGGTLWAERYVQDIGYEYVPNGQFSRLPPVRAQGAQASATNIVKNWLDCMDSRRKTVANEEVAYYSSVACFMANRAYRTKSRVVWDASWDLPA